MAPRLKIPPTRSALMQLRRRLQFLEQGHELLERKRELLTRLMQERLQRYRELRDRVETALPQAYHWLAVSHLRMGGRILEQAAIGIRPALTVAIVPRSSLGIQYPYVSAERLELQPISLLWTDTSLDRTRGAMADLAVALAGLGEAETALRRVIEEHRKTRKRVNALKNNLIPRYRATIDYISASLEEEERDALFQTRLLRERQE